MGLCTATRQEHLGARDSEDRATASSRRSERWPRLGAATAWAKFEPKLHAFEQKFDRAAEDAADDLDELAAVLRKEIQKIKDRLHKA